MKLTTTLAKIREHNPCKSGWETLLKSLGGIDKYGEHTELNLLTILKSNGAQDMLWCLRATDQDSRKIASQLAIEFAEQALPIFESQFPDDKRPRLTIQAARDFNAGSITNEQLVDAAVRAAYAAADAARAAYAAAYAADAADAAYAKQAEIIKIILERTEP